MEGALLWRQHGLAPPESILQAVESYRREEDIVADWIDENCYLPDDPEQVATSVAKLYENFAEWFRKYMGVRVPTLTWFGRRLSKKFRKEKRNGVYHYVGLGLLSM